MPTSPNQRRVLRLSCRGVVNVRVDAKAAEGRPAAALSGWQQSKAEACNTTMAEVLS
eukprot:CAMPEP_0202117150 /NCGR_PEP_ID=MMETSP0965-20130614/42176_1 /ASSEMBLY_ACC=CAM_ASM_000507 /TAXON_ID=4773 /ORGANISM="Schizochytrium aggregatum, Strain ATCC28209" /LENGTH=56 /DNA_ID=CAMNT_0048687049 /DNA_START=117 /DNA_END=284 /DNA_ORIENTATION=+